MLKLHEIAMVVLYLQMYWTANDSNAVKMSNKLCKWLENGVL
jgi:hypothetical protein